MQLPNLFKFVFCCFFLSVLFLSNCNCSTIILWYLHVDLRGFPTGEWLVWLLWWLRRVAERRWRMGFIDCRPWKSTYDEKQYGWERGQPWNPSRMRVGVQGHQRVLLRIKGRRQHMVMSGRNVCSSIGGMLGQSGGRRVHRWSSRQRSANARMVAGASTSAINCCWSAPTQQQRNTELKTREWKCRRSTTRKQLRLITT